MYKALIQFIEALRTGDDVIYFDTPVVPPSAPHVRLWAVTVDTEQVVRVMDADHDWFEITENDERDAHILDSIFTRMRYLVQRKEEQQLQREVGI